jgi:hypothetical protein
MKNFVVPYRSEFKSRKMFNCMDIAKHFILTHFNLSKKGCFLGGAPRVAVPGVGGDALLKSINSLCID